MIHFLISYFSICVNFSVAYWCLKQPSLFAWQLEEKARLEAEARAREHEHVREEQRQQEQEEERLTAELQRLQELQKLRAVKKKKKERPSMLAGALQAASEPLPDPVHLHNGSLEQNEEPETSPHSPPRHANHTEPGLEADPGPEAEPRDNRDSQLLLPEAVSGKQQEPLSFLLDIMHHHKEGTGKHKPKQAGKASSEAGRRPVEPPRASESQPRPRPQTEPKAKVLELAALVEQKREDRKANSNNNNKKQLNHVKEGKASPGPSEPACPGEPVHSSKPVPADSPQPRGKSKKSRKKKGDRAGSSLGKSGSGGRACGSVCDERAVPAVSQLVSVVVVSVPEHSPA